METATVQPPRQRLFELKSSAEFPTAEFSHSIKTWVNMASLLIKQGNMAECNKDDENAYISYVRACLIITKIIPFQPNYPAMMNDIVCIDLRQKILLVVSRIGHIERRLLKQFEQDNQELAQQHTQQTQEPAKIHNTHSTTPSVSQKQCSSMDEMDRESELDVQRTTLQGIALEERQEEQEEVQEDQDKQDDGDDIEQDVRRLRIVPETDSELSLDLNPRTYASHYRRSLQRRSRDLLQEQQLQGHDEKAMTSFYLTAPATGSLKKKSSNEEHRSFLTPECQPNNSSSTLPSSQDYPSFPSSRHQHLFAQHPHRGGHVRRCSSTDGLRTRMRFPGGHSSPAVPPRSDKRSSMMASVVMNGSNPNPTPRPTLAELRARDGSNRRTMSFEITWTLPHEQRQGLPAAIMTSSTPRQSVDISHVRSISASNNNNNNNSSESESPPSSASTNGSSSMPSTAQSTPAVSPHLKTSPQLGHSLHSFHGYGHGYSASLTSITSASTSAATMVDGTTPSPIESMGLPPVSFASPSISSCSMHSTSTVTTPTTPVASPILASSSTMSSMSASTMVNPPSTSSSTGSGTWTTTGMKAGLLRKIRSKPKMTDQLFDILPNVGSPTHPPQPALALGQQH
ncbi:hypothetical protein BGZ74_005292 [Mortierella antarctica]|nr:hypothetical protein BGZ74_005292 [Mortierella antarctica]